MFKKFLIYAAITLVLFGICGWMFYYYIYPRECPVFVETYANGTITVDSHDKEGTKEKYRVVCKHGEEISITVKPEKKKNKTYVLDRLTVNGEDVTAKVHNNEYTLEVNQKLTIIGSFRKKNKNGNNKKAEKKTEANAEKSED